MPSLHHTLPAVHLSRLRLDAVLSMEDRPQGVTVAAIAHDFGTSVPSLYRWRRRLYAALSDAPPGPSPRALPGSLSHHQRALLEAAASASAATLSLRERRAWILQLHGEGVSVRGIRDVLLHRFGPTEALSVGAIKAFLKQAVVNRMIDVLAKMSDAAGMKPVVDAAYGHVLSSSPGYVAHHLLWEDVPVELRAGATWTREQVLDVLEQARQAGQKAREGGSSGWQKWWHQNTERKLLEQVQAQVETLGATQAAIESLLRHPRRSSSLVESFNARVRVLQMSRRNVSDRLLGLAALQWNVEKREEGPRRGTSPYSLLGVLEEADERRWWEVLLDAQEQEEKAPAQAA